MDPLAPSQGPRGGHKQGAGRESSPIPDGQGEDRLKDGLDPRPYAYALN